MKKLEKLEVIPILIHRLKASQAWEMLDFMKGWYLSLLIELCDSATPGYLPNDVDELWRLAGARTKDFFLRKQTYRRKNGEVVEFKIGGMSLVERYFRRTADGLHIYNPRMLQVIDENQPVVKRVVGQKQGTKKQGDIDIDSLCKSYEEIYSLYPRKVKKPEAIKAIAKALKRLGNTEEAIDRLRGQTAKFAQSAFVLSKIQSGNRQYIPHPGTWFNKDGFNDEEDWGTTDPGQRGKNQAVRDRNAAAAAEALATLGASEADTEFLHGDGTGRGIASPMAKGIEIVPSRRGTGGD